MINANKCPQKGPKRLYRAFWLVERHKKLVTSSVPGTDPEGELRRFVPPLVASWEPKRCIFFRLKVLFLRDLRVLVLVVIVVVLELVVFSCGCGCASRFCLSDSPNHAITCRSVLGLLVSSILFMISASSANWLCITQQTGWTHNNKRNHIALLACYLKAIKKVMVKVNNNVEGLYSRAFHTWWYLHPQNALFPSLAKNRSGPHFWTFTCRLRTAGCPGVYYVSLHCWDMSILSTLSSFGAARIAVDDQLVGYICVCLYLCVCSVLLVLCCFISCAVVRCAAYI